MTMKKLKTLCERLQLANAMKQAEIRIFGQPKPRTMNYIEEDLAEVNQLCRNIKLKSTNITGIETNELCAS